MRMLYYALGGGLGHLVRARAFLHTLGCTEHATILSTSHFAHDERVLGGLSLLAAPSALEHDRAAFRGWLLTQITRLGIDCLCVDSFPAGILGELGDMGELPRLALWHVARLLRFHAYQPLLTDHPPHFARCFRVEPLDPAQQEFLLRHCAQIEDLTLLEPTVASSAPSEATAALEVSGDYWLVVHSGPADELRELCLFADELRVAEGLTLPIWAVSPARVTDLPRSVQLLDAFPARPYFARAQRIITAAGFNVMRETLPHRHKHTVLPMPRRFDDQFERARRAFSRPKMP